MLSFWQGFREKSQGFRKKASLDSGGSGFTGTGKGSLLGQLISDSHNGTQEGYGRGDGEDTRTSKDLLDRDRGPRDYRIGETGPEFQDQSNPHIKY